MKNVIIYGLGERFHLFLLWEDEWKTKYNIVGISDRCKPVESYSYEFVNREKLNNISFDLILVTSDKYYQEIRDELIQYSINSDSIVSLQELLDGIHTETLLLNRLEGKEGVEIGGPTYIFRNTVYKICKKCDNVIFSSSTVWGNANQNNWNEYSGRNLGNVLIADVTNMKHIEDGTYEFCISSNNLEHIANPLKAISECLRITKSKGLLIVLVPFKEKCFDHARDYSTFEHVLEDYNNDMQEDDLSHLDEILKKHDYSMDVGCSGKQEFLKRVENNYENRCLHHHVFNEQLLKRILLFFDVNIIKSGVLGTNVYIIGEKK